MYHSTVAQSPAAHSDSTFTLTVPKTQGKSDLVPQGHELVAVYDFREL